jgi:hypothetical protein
MENEVIDALRSAIKALIIQEVRLLRVEQAHPIPFVIRGMKESIQEEKRRVTELVRSMKPHERNLLIKRIIDQSVEEEIDQAIELRKDKCLSCIHIRYFDETGTAHVDLPSETPRNMTCDVSVLTIGCENPCPPGASCEGFKEKSDALSLGEYINEVTFFYEVKEMFDRLEEIWEEYLNR